MRLQFPSGPVRHRLNLAAVPVAENTLQVGGSPETARLRFTASELLALSCVDLAVESASASVDNDTKAWLRLLFGNGVVGAALGVLLATMLVVNDISGFAELMRASIGVPAGWALFAILFGVGFGFSAMATAMM